MNIYFGHFFRVNLPVGTYVNIYIYSMMKNNKKKLQWKHFNRWDGFAVVTLCSVLLINYNKLSVFKVWVNGIIIKIFLQKFVILFLVVFYRFESEIKHPLELISRYVYRYLHQSILTSELIPYTGMSWCIQICFGIIKCTLWPLMKIQYVRSWYFFSW